jgi:hypothetical protein
VGSEGSSALRGVGLAGMVRSRVFLVALAVLSGARACEPPMFTASPSATAPGPFPLGARFCALQRRCSLPLFAKDAAGAMQAGVLEILWGNSADGPFRRGGGLLRVDGADCAGSGAVSCIFEPEGDDSPLVLVAATTISRCFVVERSSGGSGYCRSAPVCLDIVIDEASEEAQVSVDLHSPRAAVAITELGDGVTCDSLPVEERVAVVQLEWESELGVSGAGARRVQASLDGGPFADVPVACIDGESALVPSSALLDDAGVIAGEFTFRVVAETSKGRLFGLESNPVHLRRREVRPAMLFSATWEGQNLRPHRRDMTATDVSLAEILSGPALKGAFAVDAVRERVYLLVHDVGASTESAPTLVGIDAAAGREGTLLTQTVVHLNASTVWNAEVEPRLELLVVVSNRAEGAWLVALSLPSGGVALERPLDGPVQFAVSAVDPHASVYYFISVTSAEVAPTPAWSPVPRDGEQPAGCPEANASRVQVRGFSLSSHSFVPAIPLAPLLGPGPDAVLAMAFEPFAGHMYLVAGSAPQARSPDANLPHQ